MVSGVLVSRSATVGIPSTSMWWLVLDLAPLTQLLWVLAWVHARSPGCDIAVCPLPHSATVHPQMKGTPWDLWTWHKSGNFVAWLSFVLLWDGLVVGTLVNVASRPSASMASVLCTVMWLLSSSRGILRWDVSTLWGWDWSSWKWCGIFATENLILASSNWSFTSNWSMSLSHPARFAFISS